MRGQTYDRRSFMKRLGALGVVGSAATGGAMADHNPSTSLTAPGRIPAEHYDHGGEGNAYHDTTDGNSGGTFRDDDVDIGSHTDGYHITATEAGEWLEYTIQFDDVGGQYSNPFYVRANVASPDGSGAIGVSVDGQKRAHIDVPETGDANAFQTVLADGLSIGVSPGQHTIRLTVEDGGFNLDWFELVNGNDTTPPTAPANVTPGRVSETSITVSWDAATDNVAVDHYELQAANPEDREWAYASTTSATIDNLQPGTNYEIAVVAVDRDGNVSNPARAGVETLGSPEQGPYEGPHTLPGRVEAEHFDTGGQGAAYFDVDNASIPSPIRSTTGVAIEGTPDGGHHVTNTAAGEWLEYTVEVPEADGFDLSLVTAAPASGGVVDVSIDEESVATDVSIPATGDWYTYEDVSMATLDLEPGEHVVRVDITNGGFNFDALVFEGGADLTAPTAPESVRAEDVGFYDATVAWDAATDEGVGLSHYEVLMDGAKVGETEATEYTITSGVYPGQTYTVAIRAVDENGNRSADATVRFQSGGFYR